MATHPTDATSYCSLSPDELADRIAMIRRDVLPHATASEALPKGRAWTFDNTPEVAAKLEHLVALERECCREGVTVALVECVDRLRLEVHGIDPNAAVFRSLEGGAPVPSRGVFAALKAGGLGLALSLGLFCGLPIAAAAWFSAAFAAPFAGLDHPLVVALGAVGLAVPLWLSARRRAASH